MLNLAEFLLKSEKILPTTLLHEVMTKDFGLAEK